MTLADEIISGKLPDFDAYLAQGELLDDIDEYGFTPLIETIIAKQPLIAEALLKRGVDVNKPSVTGHTALHWATDLQELELTRLLLEHGADVNVYTRSGISVLVHPLLRKNHQLKELLYSFGANLDFALDFIYGKLIGHRYELKGYVDIVNPKQEFIELDFEGFILEFSLAILKDSLQRFIRSYSARHLSPYLGHLKQCLDALAIAQELLSLQAYRQFSPSQKRRIEHLIGANLVILPAASRGHALCFVRCQNYWAKIDRGENSLKEGSVNIYRMTKPQAFNLHFIQNFLYKRQPRDYFHLAINHILGLEPIAKIPMSSQITGNCSWANVQGSIPVAFALQILVSQNRLDTEEALSISAAWEEWDKDRALNESIQRFYLANPLRKASIASMLGAVLFQACDYAKPEDLLRAEKILKILSMPEYYPLLKTYLDAYCLPKLTARGNNLLKLLDDCGVNPNISVTPIATGLKKRGKRDG